MANTLILPRGHIWFHQVVDQLVDRMYTAGSRFVRTWERRDALRGSQSVVTLGVVLFSWLAALVVGYGLLLWLPGGSFPTALRVAGSSLATLGIASRTGTEPTVVELLAAFSGLVLVAVQIAYLPTLFAAYHRREMAVALLGPRAGSPAWGPELLARAQTTDAIGQLTDLYQDWEHWSVDVAQTHSSYPTLVRFRSPESRTFWIVSQLAMLDAAALHLAACPAAAPLAARQCVQMGVTCLRKLTRTLRIPVDGDPRPGDPVQLSWEEFLQGWERLTATGFPVERTAEEAWPHFRDWRVNYEATAYKLAAALDAVPARWSGPRRQESGAVRTAAGTGLENAPRSHESGL
ncbi:hypothetical protein [Streptomyces sp. NBC_00154]|uniref:hypothetical protein n=1 Tax=Streptomyces sp. NBC_00154 TaxID=2975670 RepID=UPI00225A766F|nr:hypothetical protein [Streptomyces sp. NBC_00154]MCX5316011.1 hypothetical protein [Streptomyces sp. NBC_00154]